MGFVTFKSPAWHVLLPVARKSARIVAILAPIAGSPARMQVGSRLQLLSSKNPSFAPRVIVTSRTPRWLLRYRFANSSCVEL